ncbi:unnamed protein product [marine sediment metagenome]|uniref:t-SNARE coiled-coil homology domain-containing protein n=1 Tax=marine sediment metagenome TaxID=412755 RepID=X0ZGA5_9ZZZZ
MDAMVEVLEEELEGAFEVKDRKSLHRYVLLLTENIVRKESYQAQQLEIKSDIKILTEIQKQGFEQVDKRFEDMFKYMDKRFEDMTNSINKRFEQVDKRFEQVDKRFEDMFRYMDKRFEQVDKRFEDMNNRFTDMSKKFTMSSTILNIGIGLIILMTIIFEFIK